jgi:nucleoid-associated protein YgaU
MDQRIRLIAAGAVLLIGFSVALCFRRGAMETEMTIPAQGDALIASKQPLAGSVAAAPLPRPRPVAPQEPRQPSQTVVTPTAEPAPPPEFPKSYPGGNQAASTRWGPSMAAMLPEMASSSPRHKIVDGDTLPALAKRYLGSASRAMEIYQANRNVLAEGPDILPVDRVLQIPCDAQAGISRE